MTPTQELALLVIPQPEAITLTAPDTTSIVATYNEKIRPLSSYVITTADEYIAANVLWNEAKEFCKKVEALFADEKKRRFDAHREITGMESQLLKPAKLVADHFASEIMRWQREEDRKRREEEARIAREQEAERQRLIAEAEEKRKAELAAVPEWERDEPLAPVPPPPPPAPVRLASTVPVVAGGPKTVDKPWAARVTDPVAFLQWVIQNPEDRLSYLNFNMPALNIKAREHGANLSHVIPGVEGFRDQTLKRG